MKVVEITKDSALDLLAEAMNDINESGELPDKCLILVGGMRYQVGYMTDDDIASELSKEALAIHMSHLLDEYYDEE